MIHKKLSQILILSMCLVMGFSNIVSAATDYFYSDQNILFYDKNGAPIACSSGASNSLIGNSNVEKAYLYFINKGFNSIQSAAIVGNLMQESGVNPDSSQGSGDNGQGIAQWSINGRWVKVLAFAKIQNRNVRSLDLQLDFMWKEMNESYKATIDKLRAETAIPGAVSTFEIGYEAAGTPNMPRRIAYAYDTLNKFGSASATPGTAPTITPDTPCSTASGGSVVDIAKAEYAKGVKENPIGCDGGNPSIKGDCGPEVNKYTDSTLEYWCADFVSWVYKQAGTPFTGGSSGGWRIASVDSVTAWMKKNATYTPNGASAVPQPGDVYFIGSTHMGIVEKVDGNNLYTISGNTSVENYSNGVGVGTRIYQNYQSNTSITGFGGLRK